MHHYELECHAKNSPDVILCGWLGSKHQLTNKLTNHAKRLTCYFQGQDHCKSSCDQNMTISTVSFEVLILLLPNLVIVHYQKPECFMEKLDCCAQGQGHSKISKYQWMFLEIISEWLNLLLSDLVWTHHCEPDCLSKRLVCCLQSQCYSEG